MLNVVKDTEKPRRLQNRLQSCLHRASTDNLAGQIWWGGSSGVHWLGARHVDQPCSHHPCISCENSNDQQCLPTTEEHTHGLRAKGRFATSTI